MKRLLLALFALVALTAASVTSSVNIVVTHTITPPPPGGAITTMTVQNSDTVPITIGAAGYPVIMGQSFARGNTNQVPSTGLGQYPTCEDASNQAAIPCQWDDIATHRENGDDGTWRHATLSVLLPATSPQYTSGGLAACSSSPCPGKFQIALVNTSGTYTPSVHGSIADLCNGHDIKLVMTDVRNQNDQLRGPAGNTGTLTFDTCAAINNTGRDAPRQFAQGPVRNGWLVQGPPLYANGAADPLLYVKCYMSQTYTLSGALGPINHMCSVHNSWMNVAAGTVGNSGAPGPVGFANDPQAVSYRPVLFDGSTAILDWGTSYFDETVPDAALNVSTGVWSIPGLGANTSPTSTTSPKAWGRGNAFRYTDSGTPPAATQRHAVFTQGQIIYACPAIHAGCTNSNPPTYVSTDMGFTSYLCGGCEATVAYTAQGTGNSTFSWRVQHTKWESWWTIDPTGYDNWSPSNSASRYVSKIDPQYTPAEFTYWKQTGTIASLALQSPSNFAAAPQDNGDVQNTRYAPLDIVAFTLSTGVGGRADIGLHNEYFSEALSAQTPAYWQLVRASALVGMAQPQGDLLNEVTARLPAINNGRPGPSGGGNGTPYAGLGGLYPGTFIFHNGNWPAGAVGIALPLENVPYSDCVTSQQCGIGWADGFFYAPQDNSHQSAYAFGPYQIWGNEMYVEALQDAGERALYYAAGGCGDYDANQGSSNQICTVGATTFYDVLSPSGDERRGAAWAIRDAGAAAAFGGDNFYGPERTYFNDVLNETLAFAKVCKALCGMVDPISPTAGVISAAGVIFDPSLMVADWAGAHAIFIDSYMTVANYMVWGEIHSPLSQHVLSQMYRSYSAMCGDTIVPNSPSSFMCATYYYEPTPHSITPPAVNITDAADYGYDSNEGNTETFTANSSIISTDMPSFLLTQPYTTKIKFFSFPGCSTLPSQITDGTWYYVVNSTANPGSFQIATTPGGTPLTFGAYSGKPCNAIMRWDATAPTAQAFFISAGYASYSLAAVSALTIINQSLGGIFPSVTQMLNTIRARYTNNTGGWTYQNATSGDAVANDWWDTTVSVQ